MRPMATTAYAGVSETAVTPELQTLANGLDNDPVKIFNYVHNKVVFQYYYGCEKGAHVTYLDGAGNDMDQACLLIALLSAASSNGATLNGASATVSSPIFVYGQISIPNTSSDGNNSSAWLGLSPTLADYLIRNHWIPVHSAVNYGAYTTCTIDHVWVRVTINGTPYDLDPSFKQSQIIPGIDFKTASGYSRTQLLSDAGGTATANYAQNLNRTNVEARLAQYTTTLSSYIKTNYPNSTTEQIIGGATIIEQPVATLSACAPLSVFTPTVTATYTSLSQYFTTFRVQIDSDIDVTFSPASLQGNRLSLVFSGNNAQLWLGDNTSPVAAQTSGSGSTANVILSVAYPGGNNNQTLAPVSYTRNSSYAYDLTYAFDPNPRSNGIINASQRKIQNYLVSGLTDSSRQVLTETLHSLGLKWVRRVALDSAMVGQTQGLINGVPHIVGRTGQEAGYYVDMPGVMITMWNTSGINYDAFNAQSYLMSAMEHGVIEQNGGSLSASTVKCLTLANDAGEQIFKATSSNIGTVSGQLTNYS